MFSQGLDVMHVEYLQGSCYFWVHCSISSVRISFLLVHLLLFMNITFIRFLNLFHSQSDSLYDFSDVHSLCYFWVAWIIMHHQPALSVTSHAWSGEFMNTVRNTPLGSLSYPLSITGVHHFSYICFQSFSQLFMCDKTFPLSQKSLLKAFWKTIQSVMKLTDKFINITKNLFKICGVWLYSAKAVLTFHHCFIHSLNSVLYYSSDCFAWYKSPMH